MFYKNTRNFQELLLRQKFRQHFLDSSWSKIYGQHAKSRLQKPYMWTGIQVPVWNKHQHQHSNMLLLKKWPLRLRDGCLILRWNCSTQKTGGCFVEEGRDAKREIMVMTSTASFTEVTTFSFRGCCRFPLLASHWAKMHFIFPHIFFPWNHWPLVKFYWKIYFINSTLFCQYASGYTCICPIIIVGQQNIVSLPELPGFWETCTLENKIHEILNLSIYVNFAIFLLGNKY